jgi:hypothetical protein
LDTTHTLDTVSSIQKNYPQSTPYFHLTYQRVHSDVKQNGILSLSSEALEFLNPVIAVWDLRNIADEAYFMVPTKCTSIAPTSHLLEDEGFDSLECPYQGRFPPFVSHSLFV